MSWRRLSRHPRFATIVYLVLCAFITAVVHEMATGFASEKALQTISRRAAESLELQTTTILGHLEKYRHLPALTARQPRARAIAQDPDAAIAKTVAGQIVSDMTALSGAVDSAIIDTRGQVIASATGYFRDPQPSTGELVVAALQGRLGRASISGLSGRRSYAFSSPVRVYGRIGAIITIAAPLETIEQAWALSASPILALNRAGQIVVGNQIAREADVAVLKTLGDAAGGSRLRLRFDDDEEYLVFTRDIVLLGWSLHVLQPITPVASAYRSTSLICVLSGILLAMAGTIFIHRLQEARRRRRLEHAAALRLERRVRQRTQELTAANQKLEVEIDDRRIAEEALKKAQDDLVQSAKLAAIGQMSAALAHEYNQPLAAIRTYSENARTFLAKSQVKPARDNLERISLLVDRLAMLSKTLKSFARRPRTEVGKTILADVLRDALILAGHKAKQLGIIIDAELPPDDLEVVGGPVRLSQVFVNLISNAIDAAVCGKQARVSLRWNVVEDDRVCITVRDYGPGIDAGNPVDIFDPFYTTKEVGEGLGLGLSIAYNIVRDVRGELKARNHPHGGAELSVVLRVANEPALAAG